VLYLGKHTPHSATAVTSTTLSKMSITVKLEIVLADTSVT